MINEYYEKLIEPKNIRAQFKTKQEFISWLETGTKEDLICTLGVFEDAELYEDCVIIKDMIDGFDKSNTNKHKR